MNLLFTLLAHLLRNVAIVMRPGGSKSIIAENLLLKQQLLVLNRSSSRAPNIPPMQRLFFAFWCQFLKRRNPRCGCPRIAQQISDTFGIDLDKDVVRRILEKQLQRFE